MRRLAAGSLLVLAAVAACVGDEPSPVSSAPTDGGSSDAAPTDGAPSDGGVDSPSPSGDAGDAGAPRCDPKKPFGTPVNVPGVNTSSDDTDPSLTPDEASIYFTRGTLGNHRIFTATRSGMLPFGTPVALALNAAGADMITPHITPDGTKLYFASSTTGSGSKGGYDIFVAAPPSATTFADEPVVNTAGQEYGAWVMDDETAIYFNTSRDGGPGGQDIWVSLVANGNIAPPMPLANVNSSTFDAAPKVTADGLTLYFNSLRNSSDATGDIFVATRTDPNAAFGAATPVTELSTTDDEGIGWVSPDGCVIYFQSTHAYIGASGGEDIYRAEKPK